MLLHCPSMTHITYMIICVLERLKRNLPKVLLVLTKDLFQYFMCKVAPRHLNCSRSPQHHLHLHHELKTLGPIVTGEGWARGYVFGDRATKEWHLLTLSVIIGHNPRYLSVIIDPKASPSGCVFLAHSELDRETQECWLVKTEEEKKTLCSGLRSASASLLMLQMIVFL